MNFEYQNGHSTPLSEESWEWQAINQRERAKEEQYGTYDILGSDLITTLNENPKLIQLPPRLQSEIDNGLINQWQIDQPDIYKSIDQPFESDDKRDPWFKSKNSNTIKDEFIQRSNFEYKLGTARMRLIGTIKRSSKPGYDPVFFEYIGEILPENIKTQPRVAKALRRLGKGRFQTAGSLNRHWSVLGNAVEAMGREDIIETIATHNRLQDERRRTIEAALPQATKHFDKRIRELVKSGVFPEQALISWERRKDRLVYQVFDPFYSPAAGEFSPSSEKVLIGPHIKRGSDLERTVYHELLHAISRNTRAEFFDGYSWTTSNRAIGFWQYSRDSENRMSHMSRTHGFSLNEAATEMGAELIHTGKPSVKHVAMRDGKVHYTLQGKSDAYHQERILLTLLMKHGLTLQDIYGGYFDQYNPDKEAGKRNHGFAAFHTKLAQIGGQGFGRKLGIIFARHGLDKAAQFVESSAGVRLTKIQRVGSAVVTRSTLPLKAPDGHRPYKTLSPEDSALRRKQLAHIRAQRDDPWAA